MFETEQRRAGPPAPDGPGAEDEAAWPPEPDELHLLASEPWAPLEELVPDAAACAALEELVAADLWVHVPDPAAPAAQGPGPGTLAVLLQTDVDSLSYSGLVDLVVAWERLAGTVGAGQARALAALDRAADTVPVLKELWHPAREEAVSAEVAAALHLSRSAAARRLGAARAVDVRDGPLAATGTLLAGGETSWPHVLTLTEAVQCLPDAQATAVEAAVAPALRGGTVGQLRRAIAKAVLSTDPAAAEERHRQARAERTVKLWDLEDGMAALYAVLPADTAALAYAAVDTLARRRRDSPHPLPPDGPGSRDTLSAARADALADLLAAGLDDPDVAPARVRAAVNVTVDLPTLLGLAEHPGELAGYGPIPAGLARTLAADGSWRRLVTDPQTGHLLDRAPRAYPTPERLRQFLIARDGRCAFTTCSVPAQRCDIDHAEPFDHGPDAGPDPGRGPTTRANTGPACRRDHRLKTHSGWTLTRDDDGVATWTSPAGRSYTQQPRDYRPGAPPG